MVNECDDFDGDDNKAEKYETKEPPRGR